MPTVDIVIGGRRHTIQCGEGEESRLRRLATYVDGRMRELAEQHGQVGDIRLLVLVALLISDELDDAYAEIKRLRTAVSEQARQSEEAAGRAIEAAAERIERLAGGLQKA